MPDNFFAYLQQLELMAFFSAYPFVYAVIFVVAGNSKKEWIQKIPSLLPYAYALTGTLYLGFIKSDRAGIRLMRIDSQKRFARCCFC